VFEEDEHLGADPDEGFEATVTGSKSCPCDSESIEPKSFPGDPLQDVDRLGTRSSGHIAEETEQQTAARIVFEQDRGSFSAFLAVGLLDFLWEESE
jgi:hypothetical protein